MKAVIEAAFDPGDGRPLGVRDTLAGVAARGDLDDAQRRQLVAAMRKAVCDVARVLRRVVPIERRQSGGVKRVRVDERSVGIGNAVPHVEHSLLLFALPPGMEYPPGDRPRRRQEPDRQQLAQARVEEPALRKTTERYASSRVLAVGPVLHAIRAIVLKPP